MRTNTWRAQELGTDTTVHPSSTERSWLSAFCWHFREAVSERGVYQHFLRVGLNNWEKQILKEFN